MDRLWSSTEVRPVEVFSFKFFSFLPVNIENESDYIHSALLGFLVSHDQRVLHTVPGLQVNHIAADK